MPEGEVITHGDFSENFAFTAQDAAQGFHWDRRPSALCISSLPLGALEVNLRHLSFCADMKHDPAMVRAFSTEVLKRIENLVPCVTKIHYFADGCAAQYKNRFNFVNMCHHEEDSGLKCEWILFCHFTWKGHLRWHRRNGVRDWFI